MSEKIIYLAFRIFSQICGMKYFIFDMDGVLIDSEPMHQQIIYEVFQELDIQLPKSYIESLTGMSAVPMWEKTKHQAQRKESVQELLQFHKEYFYKKLPSIEVSEIQGVKEVLRKLKAHGFSLSIASSSSRKLIDYFTEKTGMRPFFDTILSGDDVKYSKPFPEIFLKVSDWYKASPEHFWVLEDSKHGVRAAKLAGMQCIGFQSSNSGGQDLSEADIIIDSMSWFTDEFIDKLSKKE